MNDLAQWLKDGKHLPDFMRDFHDQKDLFKAIHELVSGNEGTVAISWIDAQIYTIDVFLWFMARRGYTLQRSRAKQDFLDIRETVNEQNRKRIEQMSAIFAAPAAASPAIDKDGETT